MVLTTHKTNYDPHALNIWLTNNHGYTEGHQFIWESVKPLGLTYLGIAKNSELNEALEAGQVVLAKIRGQSWVLVKEMNGKIVIVNDPLNYRYSYSIYEIEEDSSVIYQVGKR